MAIVRELTTILDFKVDKSGFTQAEAAVNQIKSSIISLGKLFGIVFAAEKLFEYVDELKNAGKEIAKLTYQLNRMARPGDDIAAAQKQLFQIAQDTGMEYTKTLDVFREFLNESKELNISQDQLVNTVENIYKGLRLGAATSEEINQTFEALNRGFRLGRIGMRQFGLLVDIAPEVMNALAESLGKTRAQLEEMAKAGKLTSDVFLKALGTRNQKLMEDFSKRARKLGEGFTYAWNELSILSFNLFKLLNTGSFVADGMVKLTDAVKFLLTSINNYFGGLKRTIEDIGILIGVVIGGKFINAVRLAILWTGKWTNALKLLKFAIRGLGVLALTEGIIDLVAWIRGGESFIGDYLGKYEDVMQAIGQALSTDKLLGGLNALVELLKGNYTASWNALLDTFTSIEGVIGNIITLLGIMSVLSFFNITKALFSLGKGFLGLGKGAASVAGSAASGATPAVAATPSAIPPVIGWGAKFMTALSALPFLMFTGFAGGEDPKFSAEKNKQYLNREPFLDWLGRMAKPFLNTKPGFDLFSMTPMFNPNMLPVTPGATAPAGVGVQNNVGVGTQNNSIKIEIDPSLSLAREIQNAIEDVMSKWTRDARNANPLTEAPSR